MSSELWRPLWDIASLAGPYQHYNFEYGGQGSAAPYQTDADQTSVTATLYQPLLTQSFYPREQYISALEQPAATQHFEHHRPSAVLPSQVTAPEPTYTVDNGQAVRPRMQRAISQASSSHYATPYESPELLRFQTAAGTSRKRSYQEDLGYDYSELQEPPDVISSADPTPREHEHHNQPAQFSNDAMPFYVRTYTTPHDTTQKPQGLHSRSDDWRRMYSGSVRAGSLEMTVARRHCGRMA